MGLSPASPDSSVFQVIRVQGMGLYIPTGALASLKKKRIGTGFHDCGAVTPLYLVESVPRGVHLVHFHHIPLFLARWQGQQKRGEVSQPHQGGDSKQSPDDPAHIFHLFSIVFS